MRYRLYKNETKLEKKKCRNLAPGVTIGSNHSEEIKIFKTKEEALGALKKYKTYINYKNNFFYIKEFYVIGEDNVLEFSEINIKLVDEKIGQIGFYDNFIDAEKAQLYYEETFPGRMCEIIFPEMEVLNEENFK